MRVELGTMVLCVTLLLPRVAAAQVGHDPAHSPYNTLRFGQFIGLNSGLLNGNGGQLGVAPHHGPSIGLRYDLLSSGTVTLGFEATFARLERTLVDPTKPIATAITGPIKDKVGMLDAVIQFNVTGGKTWHRLAPYVSAGFGVMLTQHLKADSVSDFNFKTRFALIPALGTRVFLTDRLFLRLEVRNAFWSVSYPQSFRNTPSTDPTQPPVLPTPAKEWLANGWYTVGLSYAFTRPF